MSYSTNTNKKSTDMSNKTTSKNVFALLDNEHEQDSDTETVECTNTIMHNADSPKVNSESKPNKKGSWASLLVDTTLEVKSSGKSDVYEPSSDDNSNIEETTTPAVSVDADVNGEWSSVTYKGNRNKPKDTRSGKHFGRNRDYTHKKHNTFQSRNESGSDNSKSFADDIDDKPKTNKRVMEISNLEKTQTQVPSKPSYASVSAIAAESTSAGSNTETVTPKVLSTFRSSNQRPTKPSSDDQTIAKKSFAAKPTQRKTTINLPEYYGVRSGKDPYELPQREYDWVKRVGGLEKSEAIDHMFQGAMACAILYYDNYMVKNEYFKNKISEIASKKDELIELVCMQTTAILFHRLIKSDSCDIVKTILKNLPLYRCASANPSEKSHNCTLTEGKTAYARIRTNFMRDLQMSRMKDLHMYRGKTSVPCTEEERKAATERVEATEKKWSNYILQSVWNGNNPIHDCLYYGANQSLEFLLFHYFQNSMHNQLNHMMLLPNIQNETHLTIIENGIKASELSPSWNIIRKNQFNNCAQLYNSTVKTLHAQIHNLIEDEAGEILSKSAISDIVDKSMSDKATINEDNLASSIADVCKIGNMSESNSDEEADGDNDNICTLITNGDIEGMTKHIERCAKKGHYGIIQKTFELWKETASADHTGEFEDYLKDVEFLCEDYLKKPTKPSETSDI